MGKYWESGREQTKKNDFPPICRRADMTDFTYSKQNVSLVARENIV